MALAARLLGEEEGEEGKGVASPASPAALAWAAGGRTAALVDAAADRAATDATASTRSSVAQAGVAARVASLLGRGVWQGEGVCPATGLVVDGLLPAARLADDWSGPLLGVAVEVDGPTHFFRGAAAWGDPPGGAPTAAAHDRARRRPTPPTALKRRLLGAAGWAVVSIDAEAWSQLESGEAEAACVRDALRAVGACK